MKCPNCGAELSDNPCPKFCNYCGVPIPEAPVEPKEEDPYYAGDETQLLTDDPDPVYNPPEQMPEPPYMPPVEPQEKKKKGHGGFIAAIIILAVLVAAFATFGVLAFLEIRDDRASIDSLKADVSDAEAAKKAAEDEIDSVSSDFQVQIDDYEYQLDNLEAKLEEKDSIIEDLQANADEMSDAAENLEPVMQQYNDIFNFTENCGFGWASENFHASGSIALLSLSSEDPTLEFDLTFTEEADRSITVHWETSNDCIDVSCNADSLEEETPFTITALEKGISVVQFTNDYTDEAFNILVIVQD